MRIAQMVKTGLGLDITWNLSLKHTQVAHFQLGAATNLKKLGRSLANH
jgi:hypothetical protein